MKINKILVIGQIPPPFGGQAVIIKKILDNKNPVTPLDFERLGNVIKILGDELDKSGNIIFFV